MAKVKILVKSKKNPATIYVRFYHSKDFDHTVSSGWIIDPKLWSNKQERVKSTSNNPFAQLLNPKIQRLKESIILNYNLDYSAGRQITKEWLEGQIASFNNQPMDDEENSKYHLTAYFEKYIEDSKTRINPNTNKKISAKTIAKYNGTLNLLREFEKYTQIKTLFTEIDLDFHKTFLDFTFNQKMFNPTNVSKHLNIIKTVCKAAKVEGVNVNPEIEHRNFSVKREKSFDPYLNIEEIDLIYNFDFSTNPRLDNVRDWLIIGVWTGLRISDIKRLNELNLNEDTIHITTIKTNAKAIIPIHPQVKTTLEKRDGKFPSALSDQKFNEYIKEVASKVGLNQIITGGKMVKVELPNGKTTHRKIIDQYPKSELISSHICRRSFATNHYGKLPNKTIMAITTHSSEAQFEKYLKQTQIEHVEKLREYWKHN